LVYTLCMTRVDVVVIGAGAAGLMCAIEAGKRGRSVVVLDHAARPAEKIRISGGGRCNFTNLHTTPANFISNNPRFCVSALARYTQYDFIALVKRHRIAFHEKTLGQLFCDDSAQAIIAMLMTECSAVGAEVRLETSIADITKTLDGFTVTTSRGTLSAASLVVACGGLSIPKMGATGLGYDIARQFGVPVVATRPALVPFTLHPDDLQHLAGLSGVAVDAVARTGKQQFQEGMLFTHRGLSGPAILQISSYWKPGSAVRLNLLPHVDLAAALRSAKSAHPKQEIAPALAPYLPKRLVQAILDWRWPAGVSTRLADIPDKVLLALVQSLQDWSPVPAGTEGYAKAEVTAGGVDTDALSSKTMESTTVPGLYFIGEVVDVTGHLGGFNFQWAWSSGFAAGQYV